jgi:hypothetical protein
MFQTVLLVFKLIDLLCCRDFAAAEATKGLSARPLETFGAAIFGVIRS